MAIVINNTPPAYASLHGDIIFTTYEATKANDPVTYPNYKYVCDVYIGGTMIFRAKAFPRPDNKRGVFNIGPILRSYIAQQFNPSGSGMLVQEFGSGAFYLDVQCQFGEEYSYTTYTNLVTDSTRRYYNHYNNQIYSTQTILGSYANNLASNRPYNNRLRLSNPFHLVPFFSTGTTIAVSVLTYATPQFQGGYYLDSNGEIINTVEGERLLQPGSGYTVATGTGTATLTVTAGSLQQLNMSPAAINSAVGSALIDDTTAFYVVTLNSTVSLAFYITCEAVHTPWTLHFLNQLGGFESVDFNKLSRKTYDIEKKTYVQQPFRMDGSGIISYSNAGYVVNDTVTTYSSQYKAKMKLSTDLLTDQDYTWLRELQLSPLIYIQDGSYFVPVSLSATTYEEKKYVNDRITAMQVDIEYNVPLNAQYR